MGGGVILGLEEVFLVEALLLGSFEDGLDQRAS